MSSHDNDTWNGWEEISSYWVLQNGPVSRLQERFGRQIGVIHQGERAEVRSLKHLIQYPQAPEC
ncbi:hypothetical protein VTK26DRAFT_3942 [Humicola hyalothermophila]